MKHSLIAGTGIPGRVYSYRSGKNWDLISGDMGAVVLCLTKHKGDIYAGTTDVSWSEGRVYRYLGGTEWEQVGMSLDFQVCSLISYQDNLIAGTYGNNLRTYKLESNNIWTLIFSDINRQGARTLWENNGNLYIGDWNRDDIYRNGHKVLDAGGSCIWDFAAHDGVLYAGAFRGVYYKSIDDGLTWTAVYDNPMSNDDRGEVWAVESFKENVYFGSNNNLYEFNGNSYTKIFTTSSYDNHILDLFTDGRTLYIATGAEFGWWNTPSYQTQTMQGEVYAYDGFNMPVLISPRLDYGVQILLSGSYESDYNIHTKINGVWTPIIQVWAKIQGEWKEVDMEDWT